MSGAVATLVAVAPLLPMLVLPAGLAWQVLADTALPSRGGRTPTRLGLLGGACQAITGVMIGSAMGSWGPAVTLAGWWVAVWLLSFGVVVGAVRWRHLPTAGERPRREATSAVAWAVLMAGLVALAV